ncbi:MAG: pentapeptide repeat-containing protein [Methyloglobulus sp.]|nr:pentapeptide repeat-containing protein [Methyloglobulus sp.]
MKNSKTLGLALPLLGLASGLAVIMAYSPMLSLVDQQAMPEAKLADRPQSLIHSHQHPTDVKDDNRQNKNGLVTTISAEAAPKQTAQRHLKLPGDFRGDWGESPVYAKNDRVNFEAAAYLSLLDDNQNQPPSTSLAYWRMVKKARNRNPEACFSPAPSADLGECDFTEVGSLKNINLSGANLKQARLSGELGAADLTNANLSGASVMGSLTISPDTQMENANLSGLQADGNNPVIAEAANLSKSNFASANLYGSKMKGADLTQANFSGATLTGSDLAATHFDGANLVKSDLTYANLTESSLSGTTLNQADLSESTLQKANFSSAYLQQANLANADVAGTDFSGADLRGANLSGVKNAYTAVIDNQTNFLSAICPDGITVDGTQVTTCIGHGF